MIKLMFTAQSSTRPPSPVEKALICLGPMLISLQLVRRTLLILSGGLNKGLILSLLHSFVMLMAFKLSDKSLVMHVYRYTYTHTCTYTHTHTHLHTYTHTHLYTPGLFSAYYIFNLHFICFHSLSLSFSLASPTSPSSPPSPLSL